MTGNHGHGTAGPRDGSDIGGIGMVTFASVMLTMVGTIQVLQGITALVDGDFFLVTSDYTFDLDTGAWGWLHVAVGVAALATGVGLFRGSWWARTAGILLASLSIVVNFVWLPSYPVWAVLVIALNVFVIWGIAEYAVDDDV